jgi:hypothetical protein
MPEGKISSSEAIKYGERLITVLKLYLVWFYMKVFSPLKRPHIRAFSPVIATSILLLI